LSGCFQGDLDEHNLSKRIGVNISGSAGQFHRIWCDMMVSSPEGFCLRTLLLSYALMLFTPVLTTYLVYINGWPDSYFAEETELRAFAAFCLARRGRPHVIWCLAATPWLRHGNGLASERVLERAQQLP
jgi:hypothetical protein